MSDEVRRCALEAQVELELSQRVLARSLARERQGQMTPGSVRRRGDVGAREADRFWVIRSIDQVYGQAAKRTGVAGIGFERASERVRHVLEVVFALLGQVAGMSESLVEAFGISEVQAECAESRAVGSLRRDVGDEHQVTRVQVHILVEKTALEPKRGQLGGRQTVGVLFCGFHRLAEHAARVKIDLLFAHELGQPQQVERVSGI